MDVLSVVIVAFVVLETFNVGLLYVRPGSRLANGMGVFDDYAQAAAEPDTGELVRYLTDWVAGTKVIFVALLIVIVASGDELTKTLAVGALVLSILTFYWRLFPRIRRLDRRGRITPAGYSTTLGLMIGGMVVVLAIALVLAVALA